MNKTERINHELQKLIASIINNELNDPRLKGLISVVKVDTSNDLSVAKVYVSVMTASSDDPKESFEAILSSANYIRSLLKNRIKIRNIPELVFKLDDSIEYGMKINMALSKINIPPCEEKDD